MPWAAPWPEHRPAKKKAFTGEQELLASYLAARWAPVFLLLMTCTKRRWTQRTDSPAKWYDQTSFSIQRAQQTSAHFSSMSILFYNLLQKWWPCCANGPFHVLTSGPSLTGCGSLLHSILLGILLLKQTTPLHLCYFCLVNMPGPKLKFTQDLFSCQAAIGHSAILPAPGWDVVLLAAKLSKAKPIHLHVVHRLC